LPLRNILYRFNAADGTIEKADQKSYGACSVIPFDEACYQPITAPDVTVSDAKFYVHNSGDNLKPIVTVTISGTVGTSTDEESTFSISSSYTPRLIQDPNAFPPADNQPPVVTVTSPDDDSTVTAESSIVISGTAADNVSVKEVHWLNDATGSSGIAEGPDSTGYWRTDPAIPLKPSGDNDITISAYDLAGNVSSDTVTVTSTALPPTPEINVISIHTYSCRPTSWGEDRMYVQLGNMENHNGFALERCQGAGACAEGDDSVYSREPALPGTGYQKTTSGWWNELIQEDNDLDLGQTYRWRARTCNKLNICSDWIYSDYFTFSPTPICNAVPDTPVIAMRQLCSDSPTIPRVNRHVGYTQNADYIYWYRCEGSSCTPTAPDPESKKTADNNTFILGNNDQPGADIQIGHTYSWRAQSYNTSSGKWSTSYSNKITLTIATPEACTDDSGGTGSDDTDDEPHQSFDIKTTPQLLEVRVSGSVTTRRESTKTTLSIIPGTDESNGDIVWELLDDHGIPGDVRATFNPPVLDSAHYSSGTEFSILIPDSTPVGNYTLHVRANSDSSNNPIATLYLNVDSAGGGQQ
jgi:hypothetical protein